MFERKSNWFPLLPNIQNQTAMKLRIIKQTEFKALDEDHTLYTCAYKGRIFGVSTLRFEEGDLKEEDGMLTIPNKVEVSKRVVKDPLEGTSVAFLDIVPVCDLAMSALDS